MEPRTPDPTDLTETEWDLIRPLVPDAKPGGRPEQDPQRAILNGIFDLVRGGGAWRLLPHDFPPWHMVDHSCWRWRHAGPWQLRHDRLRGEVRVAAGKRRPPRAGSLDRQSVKTPAQGGSAGTRRLSPARGAGATSGSLPSGYFSRVSSPRPACTIVMVPQACSGGGAASVLVRG